MASTSLIFMRTFLLTAAAGYRLSPASGRFYVCPPFPRGTNLWPRPERLPRGTVCEAPSSNILDEICAALLLSVSRREKSSRLPDRGRLLGKESQGVRAHMTRVFRHDVT